MSRQRHVIRRQVVTISVASGDRAGALQSEVSQIIRRRLTPLMDRVCSELSQQDTIHRFERVEIDLGRIDRAQMAQAFDERFEAKFKAALSAQLGQMERAAPNEARIVAQSELLAHFALTGNLPWWADYRQKGLVAAALDILLAAAPRRLTRLMAELAGHKGSLARLAQALPDASLGKLCALLLPVTAPVTAVELSQFSRLAQRATRVGRNGVPARPWVWATMLRLTGAATAPILSAGSFYEQVLVHLAAEKGVTLRALVTALAQEMGASPESAPAVWREIVNAYVTTPLVRDKAPPANEQAHEATPSVNDQEHARPLVFDDQEHKTRPVDSEQENHASDGQSGESAARLGRATAEEAHVAPVVSDQPRRAYGGQSEEPATPIVRATAEVVATQLSRLESDRVAPTLLWRRLTPLLTTMPPPVLDAFHEALKASGSGGAIAERFLTILAWALSGGRLGRRVIAALPTLVSPLAAATDRPTREIAALLTPSAAALTEREPDLPRLNLPYGDSEALAIDNSGLVILWPFLATFFNNLGYLAEKQFGDAVRQQRAVALLHYLVTGEPDGPEYQLALNKVLCGLAPDAPFALGEPLTAVETAAASQFLTAVIAQATILRSMAVDSFQATFLRRPGLLRTRDGAWLLQVERETYDVVLDRFPWVWSWVKLPWMEHPLQVEW